MQEARFAGACGPGSQGLGAQGVGPGFQGLRARAPRGLGPRPRERHQFFVVLKSPGEAGEGAGHRPDLRNRSVASRSGSCNRKVSTSVHAGTGNLTNWAPEYEKVRRSKPRRFVFALGLELLRHQKRACVSEESSQRGLGSQQLGAQGLGPGPPGTWGPGPQNLGGGGLEGSGHGISPPTPPRVCICGRKEEGFHLLRY